MLLPTLETDGAGNELLVAEMQVLLFTESGR